ncbi:hypothetical protein [Brevundimonas aurantiaca]|uniref:hypothetical protein n=1 Tax=Brevundimonas aurantiaca TaxID=74316 RepID=UPI001CD3807F|nr:hypothetical protein [Brevundimonas aurantiaca]
MYNAAYGQLIGHRDIAGKPIREALPAWPGQGYYEFLDSVFATGEAYEGAKAWRNFSGGPERRWKTTI